MSIETAGHQASANQEFPHGVGTIVKLLEHAVQFTRHVTISITRHYDISAQDRVGHG